MITPGTEHIINLYARDDLLNWQKAIEKNCYTNNPDFVHLIKLLLPKNTQIDQELEAFGELVIKELEPLVNDNHHANNLPQLKRYGVFGKSSNAIIHHPSYFAAGEIIYQTQLLKRMAKPGGLSECLAFLFLSSHAGEAGHNCPIACSAGMIRVLQQVNNLPNAEAYIKNLIESDYFANFTGAQFVTEIQGGSDVGLNATLAEKHEDHYKIYGEKWFCSNAGADLLFVVARYDEDIPGTKGLALFLVPAEWNGKFNHYSLRRLKDKLGTKTLATAEIEFNGAEAYLVGDLNNSFNLLMDHVLHLSRLFNSVCVLGMARRAYDIAYAYAQHRVAFSKAIIEYPLVKEKLAIIQTENNAMLSAIFATAKLQDEYDLASGEQKKQKLLLRLLVNIQKYNSAKFSLKHIEAALSILAGNGTIENFSVIPRLLRDCIICDNWEGTHNILRAQVLKDMHKYQIEEIFLAYIHDELQKLHKYKEPLSKAHQQLVNEIKNFKQMNAELQSLNIRKIVDAMCHLYNAISLLKEACGHPSSTSKLNYYHYYCQLHLAPNLENLNADYLKLIDTIVSD